MKRLEKKGVAWAKTAATLVVTSSASLLGALLCFYGLYRLSHSILESPLFYIASGSLLVLTFNRDVRLRVIRSMPKEVRKYLYEKSLVDVALDLSAAGQGFVGLLTASGLLRRDEIRQVTDSLPEEYQYITQRGLVHLLPEPLQGALNPLYNVGESLFSSSDEVVARGPRAGTRRRVARPLTIEDVPALPPRPDEIADNATESMMYPSSPSRVVRGVQISSEEEDTEREIFVLPGALIDTNPPAAPATSTSTSTSTGGHGATPPIEDVIVGILTKRAQHALEYSRRVALETANYVTTGGDTSDETLLSSALSLGVAGALLSSYDASAPVARAAAEAARSGGGPATLPVVVGEAAGGMVLRRLMSPVNVALRSAGPALYLLSMASGGMYLNRLLHRHDVYAICNRTALAPLYEAVHNTHSSCLSLYQGLAMSRGDHMRAQVAAVVTTLSVLVAWRLRQHWRQWRWLLAVVLGRLQAKAAAKAEVVSSYFR